MSDKKVARYVQKHIVKHSVISNEEILDYNTLMIEMDTLRK